MTRIVGGTTRGRRLAVPSGSRTRPTAARVREALFSTLGTLTDLDGARVLDLYAGSGALGLEALSRGAASATLIESDRRAARLIRDNAAALGVERARVIANRVERALVAGPAGAEYDVVFADPPYSLPGDDLTGVLSALVGRGWLAPGAVVVVERASRGGPVTWPDGLEPVKDRRYGEGALWYGRRP